VVPVNEDLGVVLRKARRERDLSLRVVAGKVGISTSLLSQVENGKTHPSVKTLFGLAAVLGISLDELVQAEDASAADVQRAAQRARDERAGIARREDNPVLEMEKGVRWERLATGGISGLQSLFVTYEAGATSSADGRSMRHQGTEFAYLLEGTLRLRLEFDEYELRAGDSFCFDSGRPHLYYNSGSEPATGIWLMFDPAGLANPQAASTAAFGGLLSHSPAVFENSEPPATT
jgi:transcriptional regulator with XRE-family HTH domain